MAENIFQDFELIEKKYSTKPGLESYKTCRECKKLKLNSSFLKNNLICNSCKLEELEVDEATIKFKIKQLEYKLESIILERRDYMVDIIANIIPQI